LAFERELNSLRDRHPDPLSTITADTLLQAKKLGFADAVIAQALGVTEEEVRQRRKEAGILPAYYRVDTCAAEFEAHTPYLYSTYERDDESDPTDRRKVIILGGGPNRIGQGIEFDYCCVHACWALREMGFETIMVNCNPETVSTDYDTADRLYFEPLTLEDVLNIIELENPEGVIVQFGGQTPINLTAGLHKAGAPIWGTPPDSIDLAEDRGRFGALLRSLEIDHPAWGMAHSQEEALEIVHRIGYPVLVRPSFVLGGRAMAVAYNDEALERFLKEAALVSPGNPVLIDQFIEDAFEVDVDAVSDGSRVVLAGVMQHIEEAGVHSGDSACVLPPYKVSLYHLSIIRDYTEKLGQALRVKGLMNVQFAIKDDVVYVIEVNPRASRTVPFVSKATGVPVAKIAAQVQAGKTLEELGFTEMPPVDGFFVKEAVLPFDKLPGADTRLGPEMRSTGEVMGHASHFGYAFAKSQLAVGAPLPTEGAVLITVNDYDKSAALKLGRDLHRGMCQGY
jgi:carbamoyl-phosphate synthase large subunit